MIVSNAITATAAPFPRWSALSTPFFLVSAVTSDSYFLGSLWKHEILEALDLREPTERVSSGRWVGVLGVTGWAWRLDIGGTGLGLSLFFPGALGWGFIP